MNSALVEKLKLLNSTFWSIGGFDKWLHTSANPGSPEYDEDQSKLYIDWLFSSGIHFDSELHGSFFGVVVVSLAQMGIGIRSSWHPDGCYHASEQTHGIKVVKRTHEFIAGPLTETSVLYQVHLINCCKLLSKLGYETLVKSIYNCAYMSLSNQENATITSSGMITLQHCISEVIAEPPIQAAEACALRIDDDKIEPLRTCLYYRFKGSVFAIEPCECGLLPKFVFNGLDHMFVCISIMKCNYRRVLTGFRPC